MRAGFGLVAIGLLLPAPPVGVDGWSVAPQARIAALPTRPWTGSHGPPSVAAAPRRAPASATAAAREPAREVPLCAAPAEAADRWLAAMQASGDDAVRAAGLFVALAGADASGTLHERLVTLAGGSHDARVIAWAARACAASGASACASLDAGRWAQTEPDNAAAWLALAADPDADDATRGAALHHAAEAPRLDSHMPQLHTLADAAEPASLGASPQAGEVHAALHRRIAAARADWRGTEALRRLCHPALAGEGTRAADCERLAGRLAEQGQALPDLVQAVDLARLFGWDERRRDAWRDEAAALEALQAARFGDPYDVDCAPPAGFADYVAELGRLGEVAALRALQAPR